MPRFLKCALAGTALAAVLLAPPAVMLSKPPTQVAAEVSSAVQQTLAATPEFEPLEVLAPTPAEAPAPPERPTGGVAVSFAVR